MTKVFLGGTTNGSDWREKLIPGLSINYYDPVVLHDWTSTHKEKEIKMRDECDILCYVITPKMTGVYSIAEVVDDSNKHPHKVVFMVLTLDDGETFSSEQSNSLLSVGTMIEANGSTWVRSGKIQDLCDTLNYFMD